MRNNSKGFAQIIVVILLLILVGGAAYYFGTKNGNILPVPTENLASSTTAAPGSTVTTAKPTADPTANWKTYTNSVQKFNFKYPSTWTIDTTGDKGDERGENIQIKLTKGQDTVQIYANIVGIGGMGQTYEGTPYVLDGYSLYRFVTTNTYNNTRVVGISTSLTETLGVFELNGKTYSITLTYPMGELQTEAGNSLEKEFNQILSTFRFTN